MSTLKYSEDHEWIRVDGDVGTVGISQHAQEQLGDIVYAEPPETGRSMSKGDEAGVIESVKAASEIYAPVGGEVVEANEALADNPGLINSDPMGEGWFFKMKNQPSPMGEGWFFKMKIADAAELDGLMDEAAYKAFVEGLE